MTPYEKRASGTKTPEEALYSVPRHKYRYYLLYSLLPATARVSELAYRGRMQHEATLTILAMKRWRLRNDDYPASLNELIDAGLLEDLPADPYSDKSLVYRRTGEGFILYSVGPNFKDDDGEVATERGRPMRWGTREAGDIILWPLSKT
jgi:hypothetical protein